MKKKSTKFGVLVLWLITLSVYTFANSSPISVVGFTLMNADTDLEIVDLNNGDVINLAELPSSRINIRANFKPNTLPLPIGSIVFKLNNSKHIENKVPYALKGDILGDYKPWNPALGNYTLTAIPYSEANGKGTSGKSLTIKIQIIYKPLNLPSAVYRINAGGPDYITPDGVIFKADNYSFSSHASYRNNTIQDIQDTDADGLYKSEHISDYDLGQFYYYLPVAAGNYTVKLHFAEIYFGVAGGKPFVDPVGKRVFDVNVDGQRGLVNFDIAAEAGVAKALVKTFEVSSNDGNITIGFSGKVNRPKISAIEVLVSSAPNYSPVADAGPNTAIRLPNNAITLVGNWSDKDGYITQVQWSQVSGPAATMRGTNSSNLELSNLTGGTYFFKLTVTDDKGATSSDEVAVVVLAEEINITAYPNPVVEILNVSVNSDNKTPVNIRLYDRKGKLCYKELGLELVKNYKVNVAPLPPDIYLLQVEAGGELKTLRVVKK